MPDRKHLIILAIVVGIIGFNILGWPFQIRFMHTPLNYWAALLLSLAFPISVLNVFFRFKNKLLKISGIVVSLLIAAPCLIASLFIGVEAVDAQHTTGASSFELLNEAAVGIFKYRLYRTDCGATCDFGLNLRKEIDTPIGLKSIISVWSKNHEEEGSLTLTSDGKIQVVNQNGVVGWVPL